MADLPSDAVEVGRVVDAWGVKGWLKVLPYSANPQALLSTKQWFLLPAEKGARTFSQPAYMAVQEARSHSDAVVACAEGVSTRSDAEALKGARIFVARSAFPASGTDEFYWVDLIGLQVVNRQGQNLGLVRELLSTGPQTVLVIEQSVGDKPVERMIPFVSAYVDEVRLSEKAILVDWQADY